MLAIVLGLRLFCVDASDNERLVDGSMSSGCLRAVGPGKRQLQKLMCCAACPPAKLGQLLVRPIPRQVLRENTGAFVDVAQGIPKLNAVALESTCRLTQGIAGHP